MFRKVLRFLGIGRPPKRVPVDLVSVDREEVAFLLSRAHGFPHVDWAAAEMWVHRRETTPAARENLKRAVAAAWLDEVRDSMEIDHKRWRHARVEGLGPMENRGAEFLARTADRAIEVIREALKQIRGEAPIPPIAVIGLRTIEDYYSFIAREYDEGESATSGGIYRNEGPACFPVLVLPMPRGGDPEGTIAHELTHHALHGMELPLWIEEGLTQMMEERVTGVCGFRLDQEMAARQREHWDESSLERFLSGEAFSSPRDDEQELSYHLAQWAVRGLLSARPAEFFAFARACPTIGAEEAMLEHLGMGSLEVIGEVLAPGRR